MWHKQNSAVFRWVGVGVCLTFLIGIGLGGCKKDVTENKDDLENPDPSDSRIVAFEQDYEEPTKNAIPIILDTYVVWRVTDPDKFSSAGKTIEKFEWELRSSLRNERARVVGRHYCSEFFNNDPSKIKLDEVKNEILAKLQEAFAERNLGIEITNVGIKEVKVREEIRKALLEEVNR